MRQKDIATGYAILAAALYAINVPLSKILLRYVEPTMMASFLYLGAGLGLLLYGVIKNRIGEKEKRRLDPKGIAVYSRYGCLGYHGAYFVDDRDNHDKFCKCFFAEQF